MGKPPEKNSGGSQASAIVSGGLGVRPPRYPVRLKVQFSETLGALRTRLEAAPAGTHPVGGAFAAPQARIEVAPRRGRTIVRVFAALETRIKPALGRPEVAP